MIPSPHSAFLTANEKDFSLSLEMTMREGGTLPPSPGRRCPEGAEAHSRRGMKGNARQSFHVSASRAAGSAVLPVIRHPRLFFLTANEKDFSLSLEMTMREGGILLLPPEGGAPKGWRLAPYGMKRNGAALFVFVIPSAAEGSFSFSFSGAGMYNKKNLYMLFLCVP